MNSPRVHPLNFAETEVYDLFIATVGYEQRSLFIAERMPFQSKQKVALGFATDHVFSYEQNSIQFHEFGFTVEHLGDDEYTNRLAFWIKSAIQDVGDRKARIAVDISSQTRVRLAMLLRCLSEVSTHEGIGVDFLYALAKYSPPPAHSHPNTHVGPVIPAFSGWFTQPERPLAAVVGLGYEEDKALGAVEHVQASEIYTFTPVSPVAEYTPALEQANNTLLRLVPASNRFQYSVSDPLSIFVQLESFVFGVTRALNVVLLPFGPKLFSLCSMLVGLLHPEIAIWRVSGSDDLVDREASGQIMGLTVEFRPEADRVPLPC